MLMIFKANLTEIKKRVSFYLLKLHHIFSSYYLVNRLRRE